MTESIVEVTLPHSPKIKFRASDEVHILLGGKVRTIPAAKLTTGCTIAPCCIESQVPHEGMR